MKRLLVIVAACFLLSACGFNFANIPFLGSGDDKSNKTVVDPTRLLPDFTEARLEPTSGGMILRVTGIAPVQGYHGGVLTRVPADGPVLRYQLRAIPPSGVTAQGTARSRRLIIARLLTLSELKGVRTIEVVAANRAVSLRGR